MATELKIDYEGLYALWGEFVDTWTIEKLNGMDLLSYSKVGDKSTFTSWLENRLDQMGSIWGGSSFKFGIFSRKDKSEKEDGGGASYSDDFGWYSKYGAEEQSAFQAVKATVIAIAEAARRGDLAAIENIDFGEVVKWKIAFHFQDQSNPCIVAIYKKAPLRAYLGNADRKLRMADLQKLVVAAKEPGTGILEFGTSVWNRWKEKVLSIWKISHGTGVITDDERKEYARARVAVINADTGKGQVEKFKSAPDGAIVYLCHGNSVQLLARFIGPADFCESVDGRLQRPYETLKVANFSTPYVSNSKNWTPRGNSTFWEVPTYDLPLFEETLLEPYFGVKLEDIMDLEPISDEATDAPSTKPVADVGPLNRILYGPPGTGKTYRSVAEAVAIIEAVNVDVLMAPDVYQQSKVRFDHYRSLGQIEFVTFHPSYAYQDFVEGIRPETTSSGQLVYDVAPGVLKRIVAAALENWKASLRASDTELSDDERFERAFAQVMVDIEESERGFVEATSLQGLPMQVRMTPKRRGFALTREHSSTSTQTSKSSLKALWLRRSEIKKPADTNGYNTTSFWAALKLLESKDASLPQSRVEEPTDLQRYVLVIDEINRGNISKIFGELITLIEDDKRLGAANELTVRLPYSPDEQPFGLPPNLYLLGTMNTADRSIALLDTALRRRFTFQELMPNPDVLSVDYISEVSMKSLLNMMNKRIAYLFDRDHTIGHAYLSGVDSFAELESRFLHRIIPLLQEYFFDDWSKIQLVFGDTSSKSLALHIVRKNEDDAEKLFGVDSELVGSRSTYHVAAKLTPGMLKAIYA